ncbi:MAG: hypothetical protein GWN61_08355, partial [candidate division Zixibacteria bacterium]|nr:hypothetical protein [candidate division Zixibacteria bacterium]NIR67757.1 hypothetical protein [candidate division Zixibacteria bacterium]NIS46025.1 hypothetical protein [candidate division Zixibacteria bacterium]NIU14148.1 hypothetical protein [candidate division Zixibacteria bacterium]NIV06184.1 hypothetical protein [candidate division Zixibacteria bacterium]
GMPKEDARNALHVEQRLFTNLLEEVGDVVAQKELIRLKSFSAALSDEEKT